MLVLEMVLLVKRQLAEVSTRIAFLAALCYFWTAAKEIIAPTLTIGSVKLKER